MTSKKWKQIILFIPLTMILFYIYNQMHNYIESIFFKHYDHSNDETILHMKNSEISSAFKKNARCQHECCMESIPYTLVKVNLDDPVNKIDFKIMSEVRFGEMETPTDKIPYPYVKKFNACFEPGTTLFVDASDLLYFTRHVYPTIKVPFVLISGDTPISVPYTRIEKTLLAKKSKVIHWYAQNCAFNPDPSRFTCLPLGLSQWSDFTQVMKDSMDAGHSDRHHVPKNTLVVVSFNIATNEKDRSAAFTHFCSKTSFSSCYKYLDRDHYYKLVPKSKFIVSPHGIGLDCYRTWESLLLGAYPIVKTSTLDVLYKDLPVLIVQKWEDVTEELLHKTYKDFQSRSFTGFQRLYNHYWYNLIYSKRKNSTIRYEYNLIQGIDDVL